MAVTFFQSDDSIYSISESSSKDSASLAHQEPPDTPKPAAQFAILEISSKSTTSQSRISEWPSSINLKTSGLRYKMASKDGTHQAHSDCWNGLRMPQNGSQTIDRASWQPFLDRLGLERQKYPTIEVDGRVPRPGKAKSQNGLPDWNFLLYTLIAVSPKGMLTLRELYNLCVTWCPELPPNNNSCRHALAMMNKYIEGGKESCVCLENNLYRLRIPLEAPPTSTNSSAPNPNLGRATKDFASTTHILSNSAKTDMIPYLLRPPKDAASTMAPSGSLESRVSRHLRQEEKDSARNPQVKSSIAIIQDHEPSQKLGGKTKGHRAANTAETKKRENSENGQDDFINKPKRRKDFSTKSREKDPLGNMSQFADDTRAKVARLCYLERFTHQCIQSGEGTRKCRQTFGTDETPFQIRERVRCDLNYMIEKSPELLQIDCLAAYSKERSGLFLKNGRMPLPFI